MNSEKLLETVQAIQSGAIAHDLLEELSAEELGWVSDRLCGSYHIGNNQHAIATKDDLVKFIVDIFDSIEFREGNSTGKSNGNDTSALPFRIQKAKIKDMESLPDSLSHLITPSQHRSNLSLPAEDISQIRRILSDLYSKAQKNGSLIIRVKEKDFDLKNEIFFGYNETGKYTYFSNNGLVPYLLQELQKLPFLPKNTELVSLTDFCANQLGLYPNKSNIDKIKKVALGLLEDSLPFAVKFHEEKIEECIALYRTLGPHEKVVFIHPKLKDLFLQQMGIPDVLPKQHTELKSKYYKIIEFGMNPTPRKMKDLDEFLAGELLRNPDRVINEKTGRTLKDAIHRYRVAGKDSVTYLHEDLDEYLSQNWLSALKEPQEWFAGPKLCSELHIKRSHEKTAAIEELLKEIKDKARESNLPCPEVRRFAVSHIDPLYHISRDGIEAKMITKQMIRDKVKEKEHAGNRLR